MAAGVGGLCMSLAACAHPGAPTAKAAAQAQQARGPLNPVPAFDDVMNSTDEDDQVQAETFAQRGHSALLRGAYLDAEVCFHKAAELMPRARAPRVGLARVWLMRGVATRDRSVLQEALIVAQQAQSAAPHDDEVARVLQLIEEALLLEANIPLDTK